MTTNSFISIKNPLKKSLLLSFMAACTLLTATARAATVDLLVLYDEVSSTRLGGDPQTAMIGWVNDMNSALAGSKVDIQLRLVGVRAHEEVGDAQGTVLSNVRKNAAAIKLRDDLGADMVSYVHATGSCGVGYVAVNKDWAWNVVSANCGSLTMLHELGHNMGLNHSRRQGNTKGTRYGYGLGYGVDNVFSSIMAYSSSFSTSRINRFSNPTITCRGAVCGVPEGDAEEAYAALAIHNVRDEVAGFRAAVNTTPAAVTVYQDCDYNGYAVELNEGSYSLTQLRALGVTNDDISSLKVSSGYQIELYQHGSFSGNLLVKTANDTCLTDDGFNDDISSVIITKNVTNFDLTIQAETYSSAKGVQTQATGDTGGGDNVGWIDANDWMAYNNITIPATGSYKIEYRIAGYGGSISTSINNGATTFTTLNLPNTGAWQNWTTVSQTVTLPAGTYNFVIAAPVGRFNINWFKISK